VFWQSRFQLVAFADMLYANGVMLNWQSDWNFIVFPPSASKLEDLQQPITGIQFPRYTWEADILWGGGTQLHVSEEHVRASGVYKPRDNDNSLVHDDAAPKPVVGKWDPTWLGLNWSIDLQDAGALVDGRIHTCSITVAQVQLDAEYLVDFEAALQAADAAGDIVWAGLSEVVDAWETSYASAPHVMRLVPFADYDEDGDVDGSDASNFMSCMTGPDPAGGVPTDACYAIDYGPDDDVDCDDWTQFRAAWTGPGAPPLLPACDCPASDFDGSGAVGITDLLLLLGAWGPCPG
jgi:hypothetical protein